MCGSKCDTVYRDISTVTVICEILYEFDIISVINKNYKHCITSSEVNLLACSRHQGKKVYKVK